MSESRSDIDLRLAKLRADDLLYRYETAVDDITYTPDDMHFGTYESHFHPPLKACLEMAREMKYVNTEQLKADEIANVLMAEFDDSEYEVSEYVNSKLEDVDGKGKGRCGGEFVSEYYIEAIGQKMADGPFNPEEMERYRDDMIDVIADGNVGKLLWCILRANFLLNRFAKAFMELATERRYAPEGFAQIALNASASGDERLAAAAKRALECEFLERVVRSKVGDAEFEILTSEAKECVANVLG